MPNRTSEDILRQMEQRDRQSRTVGWLIVAIIIGTLLWLVLATNEINQSLGRQLDQDHAQIVANQKTTHDLLEAISKQGNRQSAELRCVADLFISPKARAGKLTITDFDTCTTQSLPDNATTPPSSASPAPVSSAPVKSQSSTSASQPNSNPAPAPKKTFVQSVKSDIAGALNSIGL